MERPKSKRNQNPLKGVFKVYVYNQNFLKNVIFLNLSYGRFFRSTQSFCDSPLG